MKFAVIIVILAVVAIAQAEDNCIVGGTTIRKGETVNGPIGQCKRFTCNDSKQISTLGCSMVQPKAGCKMSPEDNTKAYPDCCPQQVC